MKTLLKFPGNFSMQVVPDQGFNFIGDRKLHRALDQLLAFPQSQRTKNLFFRYNAGLVPRRAAAEFAAGIFFCEVGQAPVRRVEQGFPFAVIRERGGTRFAENINLSRAGRFPDSAGHAAKD